MVFRLGIFGVLIAALVAVLVFAYSILNQSKPAAQANSAPPPPPPPSEMVLVAANPLTAGSLLQPPDVTSASMLVSAAPEGALVDNLQNRSDLVGAMVRVSLGQGTPIDSTAVIHPGDHGFLAAVLAPGTRAVTVAVDNVTGANGLIWPGDNVDVLLTQSIPGAESDRSIAAEVVLSDVRVIATGAELIKAPTAGPNSGDSAQTVTLQVTPDQASRCLVATNLGKLSLIVHSAQIQAGVSQLPAAIPQPVWSGDVSPALQAPSNTSTTDSTVKVFQGSPDEQDYKF